MPDPAAPWLSRVFPFYAAPDLCPDAPHRGPEGPNEDVAQCPGCGMLDYSMRPECETFGKHLDDCSLPVDHESYCKPGGDGHPPSRLVRGFFPASPPTSGEGK